MFNRHVSVQHTGFFVKKPAWGANTREDTAKRNDHSANKVTVNHVGIYMSNFYGLVNRSTHPSDESEHSITIFI